MLIVTSRCIRSLGFSEDGDPALFLKIVGVHHPLGHLLVFRGRCLTGAECWSTSVVLPMVDVSDDGDVSDGGTWGLEVLENRMSSMLCDTRRKLRCLMKGRVIILLA